MLTRRSALRRTAAAALGLAAVPTRLAAAPPPRLRQLTRGPHFHWFGYYDKWQFDPADRFVLGMQVSFEHRSPRPDDELRIGMVDLHDHDRWIDLGRSTAWCWQQGCMLQWRPGSTSEILWNDREADRYVCRILDVNTRELRTVPHPVYAVSPDGKWAVAADFRRLGDTRPGYGYNGLPDPRRDHPAPDDSGIWRIDLETGRQELVVSLATIARTAPFQQERTGAKHWFNHLLVNPDGTRFEFLHRWKLPGAKGPISGTRMFTAAPDGSAIRFLNHDTSHFNWRDPHHLLAWARHGKTIGFHVFEDAPDGAVEPLPPDAIPPNGHCSYLPGGQWLLADSYPDAKELQHLVLYHIPRAQRHDLAALPQPREYNHKYLGSGGEWRCDLHPRHSRNGHLIVIDAPHAGGRQLHLLDVGELLG